MTEFRRVLDSWNADDIGDWFSSKGIERSTAFMMGKEAMNGRVLFSFYQTYFDMRENSDRIALISEAFQGSLKGQSFMFKNHLAKVLETLPEVAKKPPAEA